MTFFGKRDVQYSPPDDNGNIEVADFLHSCNGIVEFVTFLGTAFIPVKNDIQGNITKIKNVYETDPVKYSKITKLLDAEAAVKPGQMGVVTDALLWLKRGLEFICVFLESLVADHRSGQPADSMVNTALTAYERTLKKNHNMIQRGLFAVIIRATPWRKDFFKTMAFGRPDAEGDCIVDLEQYLPPMKANVSTLMDLYFKRGLENYGSSALSEST